jgi:hypothetical protein
VYLFIIGLILESTRSKSVVGYAAGAEYNLETLYEKLQVRGLYEPMELSDELEVDPK